MLSPPTIHEALKTLRRTLPAAAGLLQLDLGHAAAHWTQTLDRKLLPRMSPDFPLVAAICGGGSAGKSTLFNGLMQAPLSPSGGRAGINRRVLIGIREDASGSAPFLHALAETFGAPAEPMDNPKRLLTAGRPLLCTSSGLPEQIALLDTPDIDTGAKDRYANRDLARHSLEVADLFLYIFTNATYNNRDNTDFIARMLTGMGTRPCYLVYRVYSAFDNEEVLSHAHTVARNLYGNGFEQHVLGIYRADEDNAVAAGEKTMALQPIWGDQNDLSTALAGLDSSNLRKHLLGSIEADAVEQASQMTMRIQRAYDDLSHYNKALQQAQNRAIRQVLSHFPADRVLRRFAKIWMTSDPPHIKWMRRTGRIVGWPMRMLVKTARKAGNVGDPADPTVAEPPEQRLEADLLEGANALHRICIDPQYTWNGRQSAVPAVVLTAQEGLRRKNWRSALETILANKGQVLDWSLQLDDDLRALARKLRRQMGLIDQVRQTFSALLNVIPTTAAITYILHTGDPAGAAGIKVKLTGLLGLHDLYALVAIPATAGLSKTDQQQLDLLLKPLAQTWLEHKSKTVQALFEQQISADLLKAVRSTTAQLDPLLSDTHRALEQCGKPIETR
jgi:hypothetical protein